MPYFKICPRCEAHLDPGETCDCLDVEAQLLIDHVTKAGYPDKIKRIRGYINRTGVEYSPASPYQLDLAEVSALAHMATTDAAGAIRLAFEYGRAKGERSAKAAQRKEENHVHL